MCNSCTFLIPACSPSADKLACFMVNSLGPKLSHYQADNVECPRTFDGCVLWLVEILQGGHVPLVPPWFCNLWHVGVELSVLWYSTGEDVALVVFTWTQWPDQYKVEYTPAVEKCIYLESILPGIDLWNKKPCRTRQFCKHPWVTNGSKSWVASVGTSTLSDWMVSPTNTFIIT